MEEGPRGLWEPYSWQQEPLFLVSAPTRGDLGRRGDLRLGRGLQELRHLGDDLRCPRTRDLIGQGASLLVILVQAQHVESRLKQLGPLAASNIEVVDRGGVVGHKEREYLGPLAEVFVDEEGKTTLRPWGETFAKANSPGISSVSVSSMLVAKRTKSPSPRSAAHSDAENSGP